MTIRGPNGETVDIDTNGLKTSQAEALRMWSEFSANNPDLQELLRQMSIEPSIPFNKEQIMQYITDWY